MLRLKDGNIIRGTMVGEVGDSLLFRRSNDPSDVRVIHISELSAAWEVQGEDQPDPGIKKPEPSRITYQDEFRVIEPDEVDSLMDSKEQNEQSKYPAPEFYYEVSVRPDGLIISCDVAKDLIEDIIVDVPQGYVSVLFKSPTSTRQITYRTNGIENGIPSWRWNESVLEVIIPLRKKE